MIIVSDTSPISNLFIINRLHLLHDIYGQIVIPAAQFYFNLYRAKNAAGDNCEAIRCLDKSIAFNPTDSAYFTRAFLKHTLTAGFAGAVRDYTDCIKLKTCYRPVALGARSTILFRMGRYKRALKGFKRENKLTHSSFDLSWIRIINDSIPAFKQEIKGFKKIGEPTSGDYILIAKAEFGLSHFKAAFKYFDLAVQSGNSEEAYLQRGLHRMWHNDNHAAYLDLLKASEMGNQRAAIVVEGFCEKSNSKP